MFTRDSIKKGSRWNTPKETSVSIKGRVKLAIPGIDPRPERSVTKLTMYEARHDFTDVSIMTASATTLRLLLRQVMWYRVAATQMLTGCRSLRNRAVFSPFQALCWNPFLKQKSCLVPGSSQPCKSSDDARACLAGRQPHHVDHGQKLPNPRRLITLHGALLPCPRVACAIYSSDPG
jgi:hypothetical protein